MTPRHHRLATSSISDGEHNECVSVANTVLTSGYLVSAMKTGQLGRP